MSFKNMLDFVMLVLGLPQTGGVLEPAWLLLTREGPGSTGRGSQSLICDLFFHLPMGDDPQLCLRKVMTVRLGYSMVSCGCTVALCGWASEDHLSGQIALISVFLAPKPAPCFTLLLLKPQAPETQNKMETHPHHSSA